MAEQVDIARPEISAADVLPAVARAQRALLDGGDSHRVFDVVLADLLELTGSEYGFVGEVLRDPDGEPYLRTFAVTNIAWDRDTLAFYEAHAAKGLEFRNLETLFGRVLTTEQVVVANDPDHDDRAGGRPPGHPPLDAFLGLPLLGPDGIIGMLGVANRPGGYDGALLDALAPFADTVAVLVAAWRDRRGFEEAEVRATQAAAAKTRFLAQVSHELRTPLHAILGFAELLEDQPGSDADRALAIEIGQAGQQLRSVIDTILALTDLEAGRVGFDLRPLEVAAVVAEARHLVAPAAVQRGARLLDGPVDDSLRVQADPRRLREALVHLLTNAARHNPPGTTVRVEVDDAPDAGGTSGAVALTVVDDGAPIPTDELERIFEPFVRLDTSPSPGVGLGLTITRHLIEAMGGTLAASSSPAGNRFRALLPQGAGG